MLIDAIIEIPMGTKNKYEIDHETGRIRLNRVLFSSVEYPCEYGFIENTLSDIFILSKFPPWALTNSSNFL